LLRRFLAFFRGNLYSRNRHSRRNNSGAPSSTRSLPPGLGNLYWLNVSWHTQAQYSAHGCIGTPVFDLPLPDHWGVRSEYTRSYDRRLSRHPYSDSCLVHRSCGCPCFYQVTFPTASIPNGLISLAI